MVSQNSVNNTVTDNNFTVSKDDASLAFISVSNVNAAGTAQAAMFTGIPGTGNSAIDVHNVVGSASAYWADGVLASDGAWYLHQSSAAFPTNPVIKATTAGEVTKPLQPVFRGFLSAQDDNVTGAGTTYFLGSGNVLTVTQQGTGLATNGIFTAPVTGWYVFQGGMSITGLTGAMTSGFLFFSATSGNVVTGLSNFAATADPVPRLMVSGSVVVPMTAGDTMRLGLNISNGAGDTAEIELGDANSYFSGLLLC